MVEMRLGGCEEFTRYESDISIHISKFSKGKQHSVKGGKISHQSVRVIW